MQKFLYHAERAEKRAYGASEQYAEDYKNARDIKRQLEFELCERRLQAAQRAGRYRAGTGIAVQPGNTNPFDTAFINTALGEAFKIRVIYHRRHDLYQSAPAYYF